MVVREAVSRRQVTLLPSLHGLPSPAGPVHRNTVGRPSARSPGVVVQEVWMPAVPSSPCPRPRPASGVQCPVRATSVHACLSTRPVSSVRCGRLSVQVSAGRSPVFGVRSPMGVRCPCVPASAVSGRSEVRERGGGQAAARLGWPGWRDCALCPRPVRRLPSWNLALKLAQAVLGQRRRRLGSAVVVRGGGSGQVDRVADQDRPDAPENRLSVEARCTARSAFLRQACAARHAPGHCCSERRKRPVRGSL
jgi:hypothetical protein